MGNAVRPDEVSAILKKELAGYEQKADIYEAGTVVQVGDGIARVYGLERVMAGELVEFPNDVMGMVLNLEEDNVGIILFGEESLIKEGDLVKQGNDELISGPGKDWIYGELEIDNIHIGRRDVLLADEGIRHADLHQHRVSVREEPTVHRGNQRQCRGLVPAIVRLALGLEKP